MKQQPVISDGIGQFRQMHKRMSEEKKTPAVVLDLKVIDNPLLDSHETYNLLKNHIKMYNKKVGSEA